MLAVCISGPARQEGAVLIVALVMLLILTLVGVAGLQDTQLQEKMASGYQDRDVAFQSAESALRGAEDILANTGDGVCDSTDCAAGYIEYDDMVTVKAGQNRTGIADANLSLQRMVGGNSATEVDYWQAYDWTGNKNSSVYTSAALVGLKTNPRYVIERLPVGYSPIAGTENAGTPVASGVSSIRDYLITARGTGTTDDAVVILQSRYRYVYVN